MRVNVMLPTSSNAAVVQVPLLAKRGSGVPHGVIVVVRLLVNAPEKYAQS